MGALHNDVLTFFGGGGLGADQNEDEFFNVKYFIPRIPTMAGA
jgi:hypothetical protein